MEEFVIMMRELKKLRYILTNCGGFIHYGKYKNESFFLKFATLLKKRLWHMCFPVNFLKFLRTPFFIERLWWLLLKLLVTCKYLLFFTGNAPLKFHFESIFWFETMFKNSFLICSFFFCYNISALVTYLRIKHIYIISHVSRITNSFKQIHCIKFAKIRFFSESYSTILSLYGRIRDTENPFSRIFYAVVPYDG